MVWCTVRLDTKQKMPCFVRWSWRLPHQYGPSRLASKAMSPMAPKRISRMISLTSYQKVTLLRLPSWFKKGFFAFLDQGLFACTHFLAKLPLARWLHPAQYGAFVMAYSV